MFTCALIICAYGLNCVGCLETIVTGTAVASLGVVTVWVESTYAWCLSAFIYICKTQTDAVKCRIIKYLHFAFVPFWNLYHRLVSMTYVCKGTDGCTFYVAKIVRKKCIFVAIGGHNSLQMSVNCGVPQGSIIGQILFILCMLPIKQMIKNYMYFYCSYFIPMYFQFFILTSASKNACQKGGKVWATGKILSETLHRVMHREAIWSNSTL